MSKDFYMACLDVAGRRCVVVGGGSVGLEKAAGLVGLRRARRRCLAGARTRRFSRARRRVASRGGTAGSDLDGAFLVIAATSDRAVNERVHRDAEAREMLCNVADVPELCNFILPAVHREGPIAVAVSTGGASPALAKRLRSQIAELVGPEHAELAEELRALRPEVKERFETYEERRDYFEDLVTERLS